MQYSLTFPTGTVAYHFTSFGELPNVVQDEKLVFITDDNVYDIYKSVLKDKRIIVIPAGEEHKNWETIQTVLNQLIDLEADRQTLLVGVGGGVVTDITGLVASIYMRGISFGLVPTTLLGMVDASIGGKNGVNAGLYKNMIGTFNQPHFILFDAELLATLPEEEWSNGFAEVIKYGCIFDAFLFEELLEHDLQYYLANAEALKTLIHKCVEWKNKTVMQDEKEQEIRKLLNFGHTVGHAMENKYRMPHGSAVSIGMVLATVISEEVVGLNCEIKPLLAQVLRQYKLPTEYAYNPEEVMQVLKMDKKRSKNAIDFIVLEKIGKGLIKQIPLEVISKALVKHVNAGNS